jgi:hypothetical protein
MQRHHTQIIFTGIHRKTRKGIAKNGTINKSDAVYSATRQNRAHIQTPSNTLQLTNLPKREK